MVSCISSNIRSVSLFLPSSTPPSPPHLITNAVVSCPVHHRLVRASSYNTPWSSRPQSHTCSESGSAKGATQPAREERDDRIGSGSEVGEGTDCNISTVAVIIDEEVHTIGTVTSISVEEATWSTYLA